MNDWVHATGRYRSTCILEKVHKAFFNYYQFSAMNYMPDVIILARMMTVLDLEFERALHYHDEGYESDNDYGLPSQITRPICVYPVFITEACFDPADFTTVQCPISPFTPRCHRSLSFQERVCRHLTFNEMPPPRAEIDLEDSREYLCIHEIPRVAIPTPPPTAHTSNPTLAAQPRSPSHTATAN